MTPSNPGAQLNPGNADSLTTILGVDVWTFGSASPGGHTVLRNGHDAGIVAQQLQVGADGAMYALANFGGAWSGWIGSGWARSGPPPAPIQRP